MKNRSMWLVVVLLALAVTVGIAAPRVHRWLTAPPAGVCPICLRHEHKESMVRFQAQGEAPSDACCLSCALTYGRQTHKPVTILKVTDHGSGAPIDPKEAVFVVGSNVSPCTHSTVERGPEKESYNVQWDRCLPSILAFSSAEAADAFRTQHGGHLRTLDELLRRSGAGEDLGGS
ncbi:MAG: hypothetical protein ACHQ4J_09455 [Candidatus Binatia bacterium]